MASILKPMAKQHLQDSVVDELYAHNMYQHLAASMQAAGFFGAQAFFEKEAAHELEHYKGIRDFANDMGDMVDMPTVPGYADAVPDILTALNAAYEAESDLLDKYSRRANSCLTNGDMPSFLFFSTYVEIQVKSVGEVNDLISRFYKNPSDVFEFDDFLKEI